MINFRKAIIPIEMEAVECEIENKSDDDFSDTQMDCYVQRMNTFRDSIYSDAIESIEKAQQKQKEEYDKKRNRMKVGAKGQKLAMEVFVILQKVLQYYCYQCRVWSLEVWYY